MSEKEARDKALYEKWVNRMEQPFNPNLSPENKLSPDERQAAALEYIAYQLFKIRKNFPG